MKKENNNKTQSQKASSVLVIGDVILDIYHYGAPLKISAETPTLVARNERKTVSWGGAGLCVRNMLELGSSVSFISLLGDDEFALHEKDFVHPKLTKLFVEEKGRTTTVKERFWVNGYKLLQWDHLDNKDISKQTEDRVLAIVSENLPHSDKLVVSDYRHGLLTIGLAKKLVALGKKLKKPVYLDSQLSQREGNHIWYKGLDLVCLNLREAKDSDPLFSEDELGASFGRLSKILDCQRIVLKLGERGSVAFLDGKIVKTPAYKVKVVDTTGAGDAFYAMLAVNAFPPSGETLIRANKWAGLSTQILGAQPPEFKNL